MMEVMTTDEEVDLWRTREAVCAVYLVCAGHELKTIDVEGEGTFRSAYFVFEETDKLRDDVMELLDGSALVEPNAFNAAFAKLKRDMAKALGWDRR
jgi:hypothetical protein